MSTQTGNTKTIDWNNVLRIVLRVTWWTLKTLFKLVLVVCSAIATVFVFLFEGDDEKEETESASSIHARRGMGLSNSDRTKLDNSIHSGDDY